MIDLSKYRMKYPRYPEEGIHGYDGYDFRIKQSAIENELELASSNARSGEYEEAILRLVDIIETIQDKS